LTVNMNVFLLKIFAKVQKNTDFYKSKRRHLSKIRLTSL
jgi:hypothetical protein